MILLPCVLFSSESCASWEGDLSNFVFAKWNGDDHLYPGKILSDEGLERLVLLYIHTPVCSRVSRISFLAVLVGKLDVIDIHKTTCIPVQLVHVVYRYVQYTFV